MVALLVWRVLLATEVAAVVVADAADVEFHPQDLPALQDHPEMMDRTAVPVSPVTLALMLLQPHQPHNTSHVSTVLKPRPDHQDLQDHLDPTDSPVSPDRMRMAADVAHQDLPDHPDHQVSPETQDNQEVQDSQDKCTKLLARKDPQAHPAHQVQTASQADQDSQETMVSPDNPAHQETMGDPVHLETQVEMVSPVRLENKEARELATTVHHPALLQDIRRIDVALVTQHDKLYLLSSSQTKNAHIFSAHSHPLPAHKARLTQSLKTPANTRMCHRIQLPQKTIATIFVRKDLEKQ